MNELVDITLGGRSYPPLLAVIPDPPAQLWVRGAVEPLGEPAVAIVGSRAATAYAMQMAFALARDLAAAGLVIVSGMARGVDSAAHRGALAAGRPTVAVFGTGVDVIYPADNRRLAAQIAEQGALVSELPPGTPPVPWHFPRRNRIISGLCRAVVVVEASDRSGSLITARCALEQGRDVLAVPGNALSGRNRGSHALLRDGARIVESAADVLEEIRLPARAAAAAAAAEEPTLLRHMQPGEEYDLDDLVAATRCEAGTLLPRLLDLELSGRIVRTAGARFLRSGR